MADPTVTVLMGVHDGAAHLGPALESILGQTWRDFEFLVVDDGSHDATPAILARYRQRDRRLRLLTNAENLGLTRSLNRGLAVARGRYVARMDADDVARPERLARQVAFLDAHPRVGVVGSRWGYLDQAGRAITFPVEFIPYNDGEIRWNALFQNPFCHATVMFRRELPGVGPVRYDEALPVSQDYALWSRLLAHCQGANLDSVLLDYRLHAARVSVRRRRQQQAVAMAVMRQLVAGVWPEKADDSAALARWRQLYQAVPDPFLPDDLMRYRELLELYQRWGRGHPLPPAATRRIRHHLAGRVVAGIPLEQLAAARHQGVLGAAWRLAPLAVVRVLMRRALRRLAG